MCYRNLDHTVDDLMILMTTDTCQQTIGYHYLLCEPWKSTEDCENPFKTLIGIGNDLLKLIDWNKTQEMSEWKVDLENALVDLRFLETCNESSKVYQESKDTLCLNVSNSLLSISLIFIILAFALLSFVCIVLYSYYRFSKILILVEEVKDKHKHAQSMELKTMNGEFNESSFEPNHNQNHWGFISSALLVIAYIMIITLMVVILKIYYKNLNERVPILKD